MRNQNVDNVKNIYHVNWSDQINWLIEFWQCYWLQLFLTRPADSPSQRVLTLNHRFLGWCLVREKRRQIKLSTFDEFLAQSHFISSFHTVRVDKSKLDLFLFIETSDNWEIRTTFRPQSDLSRKINTEFKALASCFYKSKDQNWA